jgi:hypothetical protein
MVFFGIRAVEALGSAATLNLLSTNRLHVITVFEETVAGTIQKLWMFESDTL